MKITINTEVLKERHLSFGDFLVLLMGYYDLSYKETLQKLIRDGTVQPDVFNKDEMVLSDNTKNLVAKILMESDNKVLSCGLDFNTLAARLQEMYRTLYVGLKEMGISKEYSIATALTLRTEKQILTMMDWILKHKKENPSEDRVLRIAKMISQEVK